MFLQIDTFVRNFKIDSMKAKVLLLGAIVAMSAISCSTERDEQLTENPAEAAKVEKLEVKKLKPINKDQSQYRTTSDSSNVLNPIASPSYGLHPDTGLDPNPDPRDPEIIPPGDVRPPKK